MGNDRDVLLDRLERYSDVTFDAIADAYDRLAVPTRARDTALEALEALADVGPEGREDQCGPLGVLYDDYSGGYEADYWCDRPKGHSGPHLAMEDWQKFAHAALRRGTSQP